ncbi:MAG: RsmE family RNA methyltransferase [Alkalispirochaeta sp.]
MKQLVVSAIPTPGEVIELTEEQYHYLMRVRRVTEGTEISCIDDSGHRAKTVVALASSDHGLPVLRVVERYASGAPGSSAITAIPVTLYVAFLKGKKLDAVVRQVTELGVDRIVPVITRHCVSRPDPGDLLRKSCRWEGIVREATQQSGRATVPTVEPAAKLEDLTAQVAPADRPASLSVVFHEAAEDVLSIAQAVNSPGPPDEIRALVGPEGGLAAAEVDYLSGSGWHIRRMPVPVLRAETAAVAAAALVQSLRSEYTAGAS